MPFVTRCPYCRQGVRVPDHALAASLKCPKCQAWYTVVPETEPPRSPGSADSHPPPSPAPLSAPTTTPIPAAAPRPVITAPVTAEPAGAAETVPNLAVTLADIPAPDPDAEPESSEPDQPTGRRRPHPLGVVACLVAGVALLAVSIPSVAFLTRPLSALGLVLGLLAVYLASGERSPRQLFPVAGSVVSALVLAVSLLGPSLLGPRYEASRQQSDYDPGAVRVIPLQLGPGGAHGLERDGYADASRAAVQQGFIRVQITGAAVGPVQVVDSKRRNTKQPFLAVTVRIQHLGHGPSVRFTHWGTTGERTVPPATAEVNGRKMSLARTEPDVPLGVVYGHDLFPSREVNDLLLFDPPPAPGPVRVELPVEACGGSGSFRFEIPSSMIVTSPGSKPK